MLKMLQSYRALVEALIEAKKLKNKDLEKYISECLEILKPEIKKFMEWVDDVVCKDYIEKFYILGHNFKQYESQSGSSYNCIRRVCRKACKKYDKISSRKK